MKYYYKFKCADGSYVYTRNHEPIRNLVNAKRKTNQDIIEIKPSNIY